MDDSLKDIERLRELPKKEAEFIKSLGYENVEKLIKDKKLTRMHFTLDQITALADILENLFESEENAKDENFELEGRDKEETQEIKVLLERIEGHALTMIHIDDLDGE